MRNSTTLAEAIDMSTGFTDFFATIGLTGTGLVTKGIAAVIAIVAVLMLLKLPTDPKAALRKGEWRSARCSSR